MSKKKVLIINGPNINLLGDREKHIYGELSLKEHNEKLKKYGEKKNLNLSFFQSNHEGEIINIIQKSRKKKDAIIINAAGYSHTSIAILDSLRTFEGLIYEVHISNIYKRELYRRKSYISDISNGVICGLGLLGYEIAIDAVCFNKFKVKG
ncbi:MAG: type II 3-dehydroquinate dehydratase [Rickettsiales bacterium]|nr:type II 3-dehydroquinate dehydratase [Rickettsiales bacterium]OUV83281.1 MAG: type II 3-dehydroquinate dehydratase [Rickettsiales bacterium TMED131]